MPSRPSQTPQLQLLQVIVMTSPDLVYSVTPISPNSNLFPFPSPGDDFPIETLNYLKSGMLDSMALEQLLHCQTQIIMNYGMETQSRDLGIHPKYPFIQLFYLS